MSNGKVRSLEHRRLSPEGRAAISRARKGKKFTPEQRAAISLALKGKKRAPLSPEHRAAISRGFTLEIRAAISLAQKMSRWTCATCGVTGRPPLISRWHSKPGCVIVKEAVPMSSVDPTGVTQPDSAKAR